QDPSKAMRRNGDEQKLAIGEVGGVRCRRQAGGELYLRQVEGVDALVCHPLRQLRVASPEAHPVASHAGQMDGERGAEGARSQHADPPRGAVHSPPWPAGSVRRSPSRGSVPCRRRRRFLPWPAMTIKAINAEASSLSLPSGSTQPSSRLRATSSGMSAAVTIEARET